MSEQENEDRGYFAKKNPQKEEMVNLLRVRFPELFLASTYARQDDRKHALLKCMKKGKEYTVKDLQSIFIETYQIPISRVTINTYINQLEAEQRIKYERKGLGGAKIIRLNSE